MTRLSIHFIVPRGEEHFLRSRLMTVQSSLYHWLRETGYGVFFWDEADRLEPYLTIHEVKASKAKRVREKIELVAAQNGFAVTIEAETG